MILEILALIIIGGFVALGFYIGATPDDRLKKCNMCKRGFTPNNGVNICDKCVDYRGYWH